MFHERLPLEQQYLHTDRLKIDFTLVNLRLVTGPFGFVSLTLITRPPTKNQHTVNPLFLPLNIMIYIT